MLVACQPCATRLSLLSQVISDFKLLRKVGLFLIIDIVILTTWQIQDPLHVAYEDLPTEASPHVTPKQLSITKMSGKLGPNHYRNGAWDRLEGHDSTNQSIKKKCRGSTIAVNLAAQAATIGMVRPFCLEFVLVSSLQTIPSAFALMIPTQVPTRFGNGQLASYSSSSTWLVNCLKETWVADCTLRELGEWEYVGWAHANRAFPYTVIRPIDRRERGNKERGWGRSGWGWGCWGGGGG